VKDDQVMTEMAARGLAGPHVTPEALDARIIREDYHRFPGTTLTVCLLELANGFCVTGESACADPGNFDAELGRMIARDKARDRIWALEGYLLKERLHQDRECAACEEEVQGWTPDSSSARGGVSSFTITWK
jgi:hypothetical protein